MMSPIRLALPLMVMLASVANAQAPGQIPGTLPPAPPVIVPPPPAAPAQVPSVVTPLPSPSYGIPPGVTGPVYRGGSAGTVYQRAPKTKRPKIKRRHRGSALILIRQV